MRLLLISLAGLALAGCGANPLLSTAASDYTPFKVGSAWSYRSPDGATSVQRSVIAAGPYNGREAYTLSTSINGGPASLSYLAYSDGELQQYSASLGWIISRRLPLVTNGKWSVPSGDPLVTVTVVVDGYENIAVPAGYFGNCFRIRNHTETFDTGSGTTSTAETLAWAAPNVGDVQYASLAADGSTTVTFELTGYSIP